MPKWWEKEPVHFKCQDDCFKCCMKPGVVYMDNEDIENAAAFLKQSPVSFKREYQLELESPGVWGLEVEEDKACPFLSTQGCEIHSAKPKQCSAYPFWRENMSSANMWNLVGGFCPGIGDGPQVPKEDIERQLRDFTL